MGDSNFENVKRWHCFFEQSGTFKNEFKRLGLAAFDYDILDDFGQTDFKMDIFAEIEKAFEGGAIRFRQDGRGGRNLRFLPLRPILKALYMAHEPNREAMRQIRFEKENGEFLRTSGRVGQIREAHYKARFGIHRKRLALGHREPVFGRSLLGAVLARRCVHHRQQPPLDGRLVREANPIFFLQLPAPRQPNI